MSNINPDPFTTRPEIEGTFGVVTSTHWIATAVGMATLEKGGNAFDAGVATAFTLQVVEPHLNGPGGDVPIIVHDVRRGRTEVICGQGPAPARATIAHYRREGLEMVPGTGLLAACVPGTFESWMLLLRDYGSLRLRDVLEPASAYARDGYPLVERACATLPRFAAVLDEHMDGRKYLVNDQLTLADYSMAAFEPYVNLVPFNFTPYRHIHAYFDRMRQSEHWTRTSRSATARAVAA